MSNELKIEYLPVSALKPYEKNTRKHQKLDVDNIARSIEKYGMNDAIGIWGEDNIIVEGHGRLMACKKLGIKTVPVVRLDHLTDEQRREYAIAHNATAELSVWDLDILPDELAELDLSDFDFDFGIEDEEEETEIVEDEAPEVDEDAEPITKLGDIWQLGRHRLMCGDSTDKETVEMLMDGKKADMVFTDPPYGYEYQSNHQDKYEMLENDDKILDYISAIFEHLKENVGVYSFCGWQSLQRWLEYFSDTKLTLKNVIVWKKNNWSMGDLKGAYAGQYEVALYLNKGRVELNGGRDTDVWEFDREPPKLHPTMKPIELISYALKKTSNKGDVVLDVFGGSGSTLIACEQLDRTCYMMELDPKYCDVIIKRWETLTGEKAVLLNG